VESIEGIAAVFLTLKTAEGPPSGASAAILVGAAACMTGLDPAVAQRLNSQYRSAAVKRERPHSYDYVQCDKGHSRRLSKLESYG
jgi:hypothetical protein